MTKKLKNQKFIDSNEKIIGAPVVYLKGTGKMITFKKFVKHWEANKPKKTDVLARVNAILQDYEKKYGMTTEEFVKTIYGTPAEDTADFLDWGMAYRASLRLTVGDSDFHPEVWSFPHHKHSAEVPDAKPFSGELGDVIAEIDALVEASLSGER